MKAKLSLKNTLPNQEKGRQIRDANRNLEPALHISFSEDLAEIIIEGRQIVLPDKAMLTKDIVVEGQLKDKGKGYEILPKDRGKTVNLHLDSELVAELDQIRQHFHNKTQHDLLLELFKKGLDQYKVESK